MPIRKSAATAAPARNEKVGIMAEKSRTEYSFLNASMSVAYNMIGALLGFINRVVLTHTLSATYVGVNGLFLELLTLLSFSELGISAAMAFMLYRPLAERDLSFIRGLIHYYRKLFSIVGAVIFAVGLCLIPAFPLLLKNADEVPRLRLIYLIYLSTNVLSYPLLYKRTLLAADQKEYMLAKYLIGAQFAQYIAQIIILLTVRNFMLYVLAGCLPTLAANILCARRIDRIYPFLAEANDRPLSSHSRRDVDRYISATTMQKVGAVLINNTDSLILSSMISVASVAQYSNYNLFCRGIDMILASCFQGIINSVGNLTASRENAAHIRNIFNITLFINQWLYGFSSICLYELLSPFVALCFGAEYVFPCGVVLIICLNVFTKGMLMTSQTFHDSMGLYRHDRYRTLAEAGINLVISILLARRVGIAGVFIGTILSHLLTSFWIEPCVLFREGFHAPVKAYFLRYGIYLFVFSLAWLATDILCGLVRGGPALRLIARIPLCLLVPNLLFFLCYRRTAEYRGARIVCGDFYRIYKNKRSQK